MQTLMECTGTVVEHWTADLCAVGLVLIGNTNGLGQAASHKMYTLTQDRMATWLKKNLLEQQVLPSPLQILGTEQGYSLISA